MQRKSASQSRAPSHFLPGYDSAPTERGATHFGQPKKAAPMLFRVPALIHAQMFPVRELGMVELAVCAFQILLLCADGFALWWLYRHPDWKSFLVVATTWFGAMGFLTIALSMSHSFFAMRLACYGLFLHLPILLLAGTVFLWRRSRSIAVFTSLTSLVILAIAIDAFWIEPVWLEETHRTLSCERISRPLRIAIVADIQTDTFGDYQRDAIDRCLQAQPDLILLAGDYVQLQDLEQWESVRTAFQAYLREVDFSAPMGVYAVQGNTDHDQWESLFEGLAIERLPNTQVIHLDTLDISALSVGDSFAWNLQLARPTPEKFHLVLGHAPDFARSRDVDADLLVAGHTHGGQIRIPGFGVLMTASSIPRAWASGLTQLAADKWLIVSRGIGMERGYAPRLRFFCRPELAIVDLQPAVPPVR